MTRKGELSTAAGLWITRTGDNLWITKRRVCLLVRASLAHPQMPVDNPVDI